jgi:hypothetical protein
MSQLSPARVKTAADRLVSVAPCVNGLVDRFCRCFAVAAFYMAVFAGYRRLPDTPLIQSILRNYNPSRSGDIYVVFDPNRFINDFDGLTVATTHGSPWRYDTYVPILFAGMGISAQSVARLVHTVDIAPTLSLIVGAKPPTGSFSAPLNEVTRQN